MNDGAVHRMSGDFLPLPAGHTIPWLWADAIAAVVCVLFFLIAPFIFVIRSLRRRKKNAGSPVLDRRIQEAYVILVLSGTALLCNNVVLVWRMLSNNFRSFAEVLPQIVINDALGLIALAAGIAAVIPGKNGPSKKQRVLFVISAALMAVFIAVLMKWQFINVSILT